MAIIDSKKARQSLLKKGFKLNEGDHHFYLYIHNGKVVAKTKISHNDQELNDWLISKMYKQCQISKSEFLDLINCPLDEAGYVKILKNKGLLQ